jgi:hypothetical protein
MSIMKKLLVLFLALLPILATAASGDLTAGLDPTGQSSITTAQLLQMINAGKIVVPKGGVIRTNNLPDIATDTRLTNWLFLDTRTAPASLKSYTGNGTSNAETNWVVATISPGSITTSSLASPAVAVGQIFGNAVVNSNIAVGAVTADSISSGSVTSNKVAGSQIYSYHVADSSLTGSDLATLTITDTNIAAATITEGKLANPITTAKIAAGGAGSFLSTTTAGTVAWTNWIVSYTTNGIAVPGAAGTVTNSHTLGAVPSIAQVRLVCSTAEYGYNIGDEISLTGGEQVSTGLPYITTSFDTTNFYLTVGNNVQVRTRTNTFAPMTITSGNWRLAAKLYLLKLP